MAARRPLVRVNGRTAALPAGDTIDKASVGLGSVDNTADASKPVSTPQQTALGLKLDKTSVGAANGVAGLDSAGKVPAAQLPSYVDDVLEAANYAALPATGETGKIYITLDTNYEYRWSGSTYIQLVASPGSTDAVPEGTTNTYFSTARVLATVLTGLSLASSVAVAATDTVLTAMGKLQAQVSAAATRLGQLGTASNANLTTSVTDTTAGRVLKVGDFGLSGSAIAVVSGVDINGLLTTGIYSLEGGTWTNTPIAGNFYLLVTASAVTVKQTLLYRGSATIASRFYNIAGGTWSAWDTSYTRSNILGTVSQTSGVPTGAIIESGTNANGTYVKLADGTMICLKVISMTNGSDTATGPLFRSAAVNAGSFAAAFVSQPSLGAVGTDGTGGGWPTQDIFGSNVAWGSFSTRNTISNTNPGQIYLTAVGRWF